MPRDLFLLLVLVPFLHACGEPPAAESTLIRLVDELPDADLVSPLDEVRMVEAVADFDSLAVTRIWSEDFAGEEASFRASGRCEQSLDSERGPAFACTQSGGAVTEVSIQPGTSYRVRLHARRSRAFGYAVKVIEGSEAGALRIFQFPDFRDRWQPHELWFHSTTESSRLEIVIEPVNTNAELWIDDVVVETLELTPEQRLSLLKAQDNRPAPAAASFEGYVKRGRLLPLDDPKDSSSPQAGNYEVRDAIFAPAPPPSNSR